MSFTIVEAEQRSNEWRACRIGRVTGSRACDFLKTIKSGESAARRDYRTQLVVERVTGVSQDDVFVSKDMQRGIDIEPLALAAYEGKTGAMVRRTGFLQHTEHLAGCSLDGDVANFKGILEIKAPRSATHFSYLRERVIPPDYEAQCRHNLWISGAEWCDFVSFDDRFPIRLQLFRVRLWREQARLGEYESLVLQFLREITEQVIELERMTND